MQLMEQLPNPDRSPPCSSSVGLTSLLDLQHPIVVFLSSIGLQGYAWRLISELQLNSMDAVVEFVKSNEGGAAALLGDESPRQHRLDIRKGLLRWEKEQERALKNANKTHRTRAPKAKQKLPRTAPALSEADKARLTAIWDSATAPAQPITSNATELPTGIAPTVVEMPEHVFSFTHPWESINPGESAAVIDAIATSSPRVATPGRVSPTLMLRRLAKNISQKPGSILQETKMETDVIDVDDLEREGESVLSTATETGRTSHKRSRSECPDGPSRAPSTEPLHSPCVHSFPPLRSSSSCDMLEDLQGCTFLDAENATRSLSLTRFTVFTDRRTNFLEPNKEERASTAECSKDRMSASSDAQNKGAGVDRLHTVVDLEPPRKLHQDVVDACDPCPSGSVNGVRSSSGSAIAIVEREESEHLRRSWSGEEVFPSSYCFPHSQEKNDPPAESHDSAEASRDVTDAPNVGAQPSTCDDAIRDEVLLPPSLIPVPVSDASESHVPEELLSEPEVWSSSQADVGGVFSPSQDTDGWWSAFGLEVLNLERKSLKEVDAPEWEEEFQHMKSLLNEEGASPAGPTIPLEKTHSLEPLDEFLLDEDKRTAPTCPGAMSPIPLHAAPLEMLRRVARELGVPVLSPESSDEHLLCPPDFPVEQMERLASTGDIFADIAQHRKGVYHDFMLQRLSPQRREQLEREHLCTRIRIAVTRQRFREHVAPFYLHRLPRFSGLPAYHRVTAAELRRVLPPSVSPDEVKAEEWNERTRCVVTALAAESIERFTGTAHPFPSYRPALSSYDEILMLMPVDSSAVVNTVQREFPFISMLLIQTLLLTNNVIADEVRRNALTHPIPTNPTANRLPTGGPSSQTRKNQDSSKQYFASQALRH